jgi:hypothetical protein
MRARIVAAVVLLTSSWAVQAAVDGVEPFEEYGKTTRAAQQVSPLGDNAFGDNVSLYNGATEFDATDMSIPGNNALPVALARRFIVDDRRKDPGYLGGFGDWDVEVPYIEGVFMDADGWVLKNGGTNRCSDNTDIPNTYDSVAGLAIPYEEVWDGNHLHIPGAGDQELLANTQSKSPAYASRGTYKWVTTSNWKVSCISGLSGAGIGGG